jgi:hypothetical protein
VSPIQATLTGFVIGLGFTSHFEILAPGTCTRPGVENESDDRQGSVIHKLKIGRKLTALPCSGPWSPLEVLSPRQDRQRSYHQE